MPNTLKKKQLITNVIIHYILFHFFNTYFQYLQKSMSDNHLKSEIFQEINRVKLAKLYSLSKNAEFLTDLYLLFNNAVQE